MITLIIVLTDECYSQWWSPFGWGDNYYDTDVSEESKDPPRTSIALEEFCTSEPRALPNDTIQCSSCENRCDWLTQAEPWRGTEGCSCDKYCLTNGDCCLDFETFCPKEYSEAQDILHDNPSRLTLNDFSCIYIPYVGEKLLIDKCPDGSPCKYAYTLSDDPNMFVPMYDPGKGITYASGHCAICNNANHLTPHPAEFICREKFGYGSIFGQDSSSDVLSKVGETINTTDELREMANHTECFLTYKESNGYGNLQYRPCVKNVVKECAESCLNDELISNCSSYQGYASLFGQVYRNVHCALCSNIDANTDNTLCKKMIPCDPWDWGCRDGVNPVTDNIQTFSLAMVFDFNPASGLTVGHHVTPDCPIGEQYVWDEDACRPITCPIGKTLEANDCIPGLSNLTVTIRVECKETFLHAQKQPFLEGMERLNDASRNSTITILQSLNISDQNLEVNIDANVGNESMKVIKTMKCNCDFGEYRQNNGTISDLRHIFMTAFEKDLLGYMAAKRIKSKSIEMEVEHSLAWNGTWNTSDPGCVWLLYEKDEVSMGNNTVTIVKTRKQYPAELFRDIGDVMAICIDNIVGNEEDEADIVDQVLGLTTIICVGLSMICLLIRIVLQLVTNHFKTKPGRLQFHLVLALFFMYVTLLLGPAFTKWNGLCELVAILLSYAFLASFTWMSVIAKDTWFTFKSSNAFSKVNETEAIWKYSLIAWGLPIVIMIVPIYFNHADIDDRFKPHFGGDRCWYTERYAMLVFFGIPIAISILLNIILYISTSHNLHKAFKSSIQASKYKYHFTTYIRLFIIMGITWVFGFISTFSNWDVMDFIFVILAGLQGLFLFISVVCNKRALSCMGKKHSISKVSSSTGTVGTRSSTLPSVSNISGNIDNDFQKPVDSTI